MVSAFAYRFIFIKNELIQNIIVKMHIVFFRNLFLVCSNKNKVNIGVSISVVAKYL